VKDDGDFFAIGESLEVFDEVVVGGEGDDFHWVHGSGKGRGDASEANDVVSGLRKAFGKERTELAGGGIAKAANLVDGFVARAGCDDNSHELKVTLRTIDVSERAGVTIRAGIGLEI